MPQPNGDRFATEESIRFQYGEIFTAGHEINATDWNEIHKLEKGRETMKYILKYTAYLQKRHSKLTKRSKITGVYMFLTDSPPDDCDDMDEHFEPYFQIENEEDGEVEYVPVREVEDHYKFVTK